MSLLDDLKIIYENCITEVMTAKTLLRTPYQPDQQLLENEILRLSRLIDVEPNGKRHTDLCAAFRALNWARNPTAFTAPSDCVLP